MSRRPSIPGLFLLFLAMISLARAEALPTVADKTADLERLDGLLTVFLDREQGQVWLQVPPAPAGQDGWSFIYVEGLTSGLGSNPVGLDRSQLGESRLVTLRRLGGRVLLEQPNLNYRALSKDVAEQRAVRESFATSVLWGGEVAAADPDGTVLVDFTSFIVRDAHGAVATLDQSDQGGFQLAADRSALDPDALLAFPDNVEFEALLTFTGNQPGAQVRATAPTPSAITLRQHHSFIRLPDDGYETRAFDPRAGSFDLSFQDYAVPLDQPMQTRWIVRHRLGKKDRIIYYVDRGVPEPVRSALLEGAAWWEEAFAAAGFPGQYKVKLLPEGVHPLDVRYNVIQWVHRATRGWSYGGGIIDPRTGEMIKGHVLLGSLRVRQDRLLFEGLAGTGKTGTGSPDDPVELALARIRQLSAHEVGHTLGLAHNFAASTYGRASVMDYPAPLVTPTASGDLDFSSAYAVGAGAWDIFAIRYAYMKANEDELQALVAEGLADGLLFLTDADARPAGAAEPRASLWDNGDDPVAALANALAVRRIALDRFGEDVVAPGRPLAYVQEALAPVYFHHRFQLDAAVKMIGGLYTSYNLRGDGQPPARMVDAQVQREALQVIIGILDPASLDIPESVLAMMTPRPGRFGRNRELFRGNTDPVFDPLAAAAAASGQVVDALLQPQRVQRLVDFKRRHAHLPGLEEVLEALAEVLVGHPTESPRHAELRRVAGRTVLDGMLGLAANPAVTTSVRSRVEQSLAGLNSRLMDDPGNSTQEQAHRILMAADISRYLERPDPAAAAPAQAPDLPPGSPIGSVWSTSDMGCSFRH